jgi:uncharacterized membrane protein (DUF4010 family)
MFSAEPQDMIGVLIALLGGAAVGLERQWSGHATGPTARFGGVRTFTLLGGLAGLAGWLWVRQLEVFAAVLLVGAVGVVVAAYVAASRQSVDATTEVAALVVLAAGVLAGTGSWTLAAGTIAITTLLLVEKSRLHALAERMDDTPFRAGVRFAVMAVVILPLLPEGPYGPWGGVRPRELWLLVLFFSGISFAGYLARRAVGVERGYPVAGLLGGIISSTNVTLRFAQASRLEPNLGVPLAAGVVAASTMLFVRVLLATVVLNAPLARLLLWYIAAPLVAGALGLMVAFRQAGHPAQQPPPPSNPLQVWSAVQMAVLFQAVFYLMYGLRTAWGTSGVLASGAILGLTDMDALILSMARGVVGVPHELAAQAIVIGILSNTALKIVLSLAIGRSSFSWRAAAGLALIGAVLLVSFLLLR